ncbi:MAG: tRNA adenosine(34) deaminase TadA [Anaerovoracaceae bacterium]|jgi:tRNA(adenine34) deaminase
MEKYMIEALKEAKKAERQDEVPIGAVVVDGDGQIIGRGHNQTRSLKDPTAHGEIMAIREATKKLGRERLVGCDLVVTVEPCSMCAGAIVLARLRKVYIGIMDPKGGACGSVLNVLQNEKLNHFTEIQAGIMQQECERIMKDFFKKCRERNGGSSI